MSLTVRKRPQLTPLLSNTFDSDLDGWTNVGTGTDWAWSSDLSGSAKVAVTSPTQPKRLEKSIDVVDVTETHIIKIVNQQSGGFGVIKLLILNAGGTLIFTSSNITATGTNEIIVPSNIMRNAATFRISATVSGGSRTFWINSISIYVATELTSTWNAVGNPVIYKMQRKDFTFNQINNNSSFVQLQFNGVDITGSFANGDSIYVKSDNYAYDSFGTPTAEAFSGGNTLITTNIPYGDSATTGFCNNNTLRPLYRVEVEVYNSADELLNESPFTYSPTSKGALTIDIRAILRAYLLPDIDFDLTGTTEVFEDTDFVGFYIKYREVWTGSAESQTDDVANQFFAVLGSNQIPAPYGGNLFEYAISETKLLTKFTRLTMWRGYPFLVSAIINEDITNDVYLDANPDSTTPADYAGKLIAFDLNQIITDQTVDQVTIQVFEDDTVVALSESLTVRLLEPCANPIYLVARNSLGGILQWMFDVTQEYTFDYGNGIKSKRLLLSTFNLTLNEWESLQDFITLGEIYRNNIVELTPSTIKTHTRIGQQAYVVDSSGNKTGVIILPTRNTTYTKQRRHTFELEIEYPGEFAV